MEKLKTFFYSLKKSLFSPNYYQDVLKAKFSFSLKFFLFSCFLLSLVLGTIYSIAASKGLKKFIQEAKNLPDFYPEDLVIEIKDGQVKTNQEEPFFIPMPRFPDDGLEETFPLTNLLVIDTQADIGDLEKYQTIALLTRNSLVVKTQETTQEIRAYSLKEVGDFTLNQALIKTFWQKISPYFQYIIPLVFLFIFLGLFIAIPSSKLIHLVIFSLITLILAKILKTKVGYKKSLQINLHAFVLPTFIEAIFGLMGVQRIPIPFFYSLVLLIFNLVILASLKEKKS